MGFIIPFYIIFGTNLLTGGPVPVSVFAYFSVSQKRNIKWNPNGMKPSRGYFLEQTQSRRLGVEVKEATRRPLVACGELPGRPAGRGVALTGWSHSLYRGCVRWLRQPRPEGAVLEACPAVQRGARLASCKERSFKCSMV